MVTKYPIEAIRNCPYWRCILTHNTYSVSTDLRKETISGMTLKAEDHIYDTDCTFCYITYIYISDCIPLSYLKKTQPNNLFT